MASTPDERPATGDTAKLVYILYLVSLATGVTALIGVVMAYMHRDAAPEWLRSHYRFQIRTFWLALLYMGVGVLLTLMLIGFLVMLAVAVWLVVRCVKGLKYLDRREAYPQPDTWLF